MDCPTTTSCPRASRKWNDPGRTRNWVQYAIRWVRYLQSFFLNYIKLCDGPHWACRPWLWQKSFLPLRFHFVRSRVKSVYLVLVCLFVCVGSALLSCGEVQRQLSDAERKFVQSTNIHFLRPLRSFTEGEYRNIQVLHTVTHTNVSEWAASGLWIFLESVSWCVFVTGWEQDVAEQAFGLRHRQIQAEKSSRGRDRRQSESLWFCLDLQQNIAFKSIRY